MIRYINELNPEFLAHKRVLLRVDFNISLSKDGKYDRADLFRVKASEDTIKYLLRNGAIVGLIAHRGDDLSFHDVIDEISEVLNLKIPLVLRIEDLSRKAQQNKIALFENIRLKNGEITNDDHFAKVLSTNFDIYVNDAFSVSHRDHSSVSAITKHLPSYGGLLLQKEINLLSEFIEAPKKGKTLIVGGAKSETKIPIIQSFIDRASNILIGGATANEILRTRKFRQEDNILLPQDFIISKETKGKYSDIKSWPANKKMPSHYHAFDIGEKTVDEFLKIIKKSSVVLWNGPLGLAETPPFDNATLKIARALDSIKCIIGGGDTISYLLKHKAIPSQALVSTGGGAMLSYLAGDKLPGLEALGYDK